jgi:hypothetical protein
MIAVTMRSASLDRLTLSRTVVWLELPWFGIDAGHGVHGGVATRGEHVNLVSGAAMSKLVPGGSPNMDPGADPSLPDDPTSNTRWVPVGSLLPADSPRLNGEDLEHIRMLAALDAKLPPIIVHQATMRVIDGMHRLGAAQLRNDDVIEVRFFHGSEEEAFVLAVKANIAHGRPLSLADRTTAAERIIASHPAWSDRAIAAAAGISARMVATIRHELETEGDGFNVPKSRVGRDGRMRPVDNAEGRLKAVEVIRDLPQASLREIALKAGVSPATARDVRRRIQQGEDPVPHNRRRTEHRSRDQPASRDAERAVQESDIDVVLQGLKSDPTLRLSESGRGLLRWIAQKALRPGEWRHVSNDLPSHVTYILADVAHHCAYEWQQVANELDERLRRMA